MTRQTLQVGICTPPPGTSYPLKKIKHPYYFAKVACVEEKTGVVVGGFHRWGLVAVPSADPGGACAREGAKCSGEAFSQIINGAVTPCGTDSIVVAMRNRLIRCIRLHSIRIVARWATIFTVLFAQRTRTSVQHEVLYMKCMPYM